jgi:hypothetical protein
VSSIIERIEIESDDEGPQSERNHPIDASNRGTGIVRIVCWMVALALGALQTWAQRFPIGEDGLSYLDIADAYIRHDWHNAFNAYWSPVYSWILAVGLAVARPAPFLESTVIHIINFLIYVCALAAFEFFLRQLLTLHRRRAAAAADAGDMRLPANALIILAYGLFIWVSFEWITVPLESPDMTLTVFVYLATGLLLRMRLQPPSIVSFAALGVFLGFGYLTKSAMFPLSLVFLAVPPIVLRRQVPWRGIATAAVAFAVVAGPYIAIISSLKGRVTFGDTGKLAYVWFANGAMDRELHWWREFPDDRRPVHPTRKVFERPAIYEFGSSPVPGTYPVWYDPSYWHEGETPHLDLRGQLRVLRWSAQEWWRLFVDEGILVVFGGFILLAVAFRSWTLLGREVEGYAELFIPAVAASAMYSLVLLSPRYVAVFLLLSTIGLFAIVRLPRSRATRRLAWAVPTGVLVMIGLRLIPFTAAQIDEWRGQRNPGAHRSWEIAQGLRQLGAAAGDKVARIGYGPPAYWARLAQVRIVAEMFSEEAEFSTVPNMEAALQPDGTFKPEVIQAFADTGAKFVIAWKPPADVARHGWHELGEKTQWFAYPLSR